jgi:hypothetical protein
MKDGKRAIVSCLVLGLLCAAGCAASGEMSRPPLHPRLQGQLRIIQAHQASVERHQTDVRPLLDAQSDAMERRRERARARLEASR